MAPHGRRQQDTHLLRPCHGKHRRGGQRCDEERIAQYYGLGRRLGNHRRLLWSQCFQHRPWRHGGTRREPYCLSELQHEPGLGVRRFPHGFGHPNGFCQCNRGPLEGRSLCPGKHYEHHVREQFRHGFGQPRSYAPPLEPTSRTTASCRSNGSRIGTIRSLWARSPTLTVSTRFPFSRTASLSRFRAPESSFEWSLSPNGEGRQSFSPPAPRPSKWQAAEGSFRTPTIRSHFLAIADRSPTGPVSLEFPVFVGFS